MRTISDEYFEGLKECVPLNTWENSRATFFHLLNAFMEPEDKDYLGLLMLEAAKHGNAQVLGIMLSLGVNPNIVDRKKETAMSLAASGGHKSCLKLLKFYGAPLRYRIGDKGRTIFDCRTIAEENGYSLK